MASDIGFLTFILENLSLPEVSYRKMMGEFLLYLNGKVVGGIYDDRLLFKMPPKIKEKYAGFPTAIPYDGGKEMLYIENVEDKALIKRIILDVYNEVTEKK